MIFQDHPLGAALAAVLWDDAKPLPTVGLRPLSCTPGEGDFGRTFLAAKKSVRPSSVNEISDAMRELTFSPPLWRQNCLDLMEWPFLLLW